MGLSHRRNQSSHLPDYSCSCSQIYDSLMGTLGSAKRRRSPHSHTIRRSPPTSPKHRSGLRNWRTWYHPPLEEWWQTHEEWQSGYHQLRGFCHPSVASWELRISASPKVKICLSLTCQISVLKCWIIPFSFPGVWPLFVPSFPVQVVASSSSSGD